MRRDEDAWLKLAHTILDSSIQPFGSALAYAGSKGCRDSMTPEPTNRPAIETDGLCRYFQMGNSEVRAVDGVSVKIAADDFVALLGPSGSGKSSLLNLLAGLDRPTAGTVSVQGKDLAQLSPDELAGYRLRTAAMVFQSFNLIPTMTLLENVELPMRFAEVDRAQRLSLARGALDRVGLAPRAHHRPAQLSGGEQQRAAIARALINGPKLLLADEPTGNLDSRTGAEIMTLIAACRASLGMTVVMVTHERALAERYARRMLFLEDGRLTDDVENRASI